MAGAARLLRHIDDTEALTAANHGMTLTFAFNHGGRAELTDGDGRASRREVRAGQRRVPRSTRTSSPATSTRPTCPTPTCSCAPRASTASPTSCSGSRAYSEFVFTDVLWPDFRRDDLFDAVAEFQRRERRFGAIEPT